MSIIINVNTIFRIKTLFSLSLLLCCQLTHPASLSYYLNTAELSSRRHFALREHHPLQPNQNFDLREYLLTPRQPHKIKLDNPLTFIDLCKEILNDRQHCSMQNQEHLEHCIKNTAASQSISKIDKKIYRAIRAEIDNLWEKDIKNFVHECEQIKASLWSTKENNSEIDARIESVNKRGHTTEEDAKWLDSLKERLISAFVTSCQSLMQNPYSSPEDRTVLEALIKKSSYESCISVETREQHADIHSNIELRKQKELDAFVQECLEEKRKPWNSQQDLTELIDKVCRTKQVSKEERDRLQEIKSQCTEEFSSCCRELCYEELCPPKYKQALDELRERFRKDPCVKPEDEQLYEKAKNEISHLQEQRKKELDNFLARCNSAKQSQYTTEIPQLLNLMNRATKQGKVLESDEKELRTIETEITQAEHEAKIRDEELRYSREWKQKLSPDQQAVSTAINGATSLPRELASMITLYDDEAERKSLAEVSAFVSACNAEIEQLGDWDKGRLELQEYMRSVQKKGFVGVNDVQFLSNINVRKADFRENVQRQKRINLERNNEMTRKRRQEKTILLLSALGPLVLAFGHGVLNNWLTRRAGSDAKQIPFYKAPAREWAIGYIALCFQWLLGTNLERKLKTYPANCSIYVPAYFASIGLMQNLGERIPLGNTGWRTPINPASSALTNLLLANYSLFFGSIGSAVMLLVGLIDNRPRRAPQLAPIDLIFS